MYHDIFKMDDSKQEEETFIQKNNILLDTEDISSPYGFLLNDKLKKT